MHPRPSPIAASLYTLRDLNVNVVILHGPQGCCFRTARLLENDGVHVLTTAMSENDFIFGASAKLEETLKKAYELFFPKYIGIVGTCASMIIGENLKEAINNVNIPSVVLSIESHGGFGEGDNTEGAIIVLETAVNEGLISSAEADRQIKMLKMATDIEKSRGMAQKKYICPSWGDNPEEIALNFINALKNNEKVALILNAKKETAYLFADILNLPFNQINPDNPPVIYANLDTEIGLPRIREHSANITKELLENGIFINKITGGLDEYPAIGDSLIKELKNRNFDLIMILGFPHTLNIKELDLKSIAVTDGPRLVEPLKNIGFDNVIVELDAHSKTLGTNKIVKSDFGEIIRSKI